jgi:thiol-disulfide isomerase/thioredoxin
MRAPKLFLLIAFVFALPFLAIAQTAHIEGNVEGLKNAEVVITYYNAGEKRNQTVNASNGKFTVDLPMAYPQKILVRFPEFPLQVYAEAGNISITGNQKAYDSFKVQGSKFQLEGEAFAKLMAPVQEREFAIYEQIGRAQGKEKIALEIKRDSLMKKSSELVGKYVKDYPESSLSLTLVSERSLYLTFEDVKPLYSKLGPVVKKTPEGKRLTEKLALLKRTAIGEKISNFQQSDLNGKMVNFDQFKNKYVFIDFWASWCGPCRAENPNVVSAYQKYKAKGFEVLGISLDTNAKAWKKAINDDGLHWTQLSDLKGWKNDVALYFGVSGVPTSLLIDPQGKVIAKNIRGEYLQEKLANIFGERSK